MSRLATGGFLAAWLATSAASADSRLDNISDADKHAARELVNAGDEKLRAGDYKGALNDYQGADEIMKVPTTGVEVARTLVLLGRLREAREVYQRVADYPQADDEPQPFTAARAKAVEAVEDLASRIPSVRVEVVLAVELQAGQVAAIDVDGVSTNEGAVVPLDPGEHTIDVKAPGHQAATQTVTLAEGEKKNIRIVLQEPTGDSEIPGATVPMWTWIGVGVAGAGTIVGGVTGGLSLSKADDVKAQAVGDNLYPESARETQEDSVLLAHVSTASIAVAGAGAALAIVGFVMFALDDGRHESEGVSVSADGRLTWRF